MSHRIKPSSNPETPRLIVNADDFGRSESINRAVVIAHREGILTTASLMVNEPAFDQAVCLARENPRLGVGLHLTLTCGHSALNSAQIPRLVNSRNEFTASAVSAGFQYFFSNAARAELEKEIDAQFQKFHATGLVLDHVNGHLNIHLHPSILGILTANARRWSIKHIRLTRDPLGLNLGIARGQLAYRLSHAAIFSCLSACALPRLRAHDIRHTQAVFGLLQNARMDESYILNLLPKLPRGDSELYSHPSLDEFRHEMDALMSSRVLDLVQQLGIELIRYQDL